MAGTDQACRNPRGPRRSPATSHLTEEETKVGTARPPGHHHTAGEEAGPSDRESVLTGLPSGADPVVGSRQQLASESTSLLLSTACPPPHIQQGPSSLTAAPTCILDPPRAFQKPFKLPTVASVLGWAPLNNPRGAASCGQEEEETCSGGEGGTESLRSAPPT